MNNTRRTFLVQNTLYGGGITHMRLLEYEAKNLLSACGVPIPRSKVFAANELQAIAAPIVLKSQVPIGGRGKLGGVQIVRRQSAIESAARKMFNLKIKGIFCRQNLTSRRNPR